jgi:uncharacterized membrane protein
MRALQVIEAKFMEWAPRNFLTGNWWWWRASRVIQDYDFVGNDKEVISEFPMFSFILGDLHPHVLVMPFAFLSIALALNLFLGGGRGLTKIYRWKFEITPQTMLLAALTFGGLAFLNIWEFPVHVGLFAAAYIFWKAGENGWGWQRLSEFLVLGMALGISAAILYAPYFVGFASQAGGLIPNLMYPTRGAQMWVMFGTLWIPIFGYLFYRYTVQGTSKWYFIAPTILLLISLITYGAVGTNKIDQFIINFVGDTGLLIIALPITFFTIVMLISIFVEKPDRYKISFRVGFLISIGVMLGLWLFSLLLPTFLPPIGGFLIPLANTLASSSNQLISNFGFSLQQTAANLSDSGSALLGLLGAPSIPELFSEAFTRRWQNAGGWITLLVLLSLIVGLLWQRPAKDAAEIKTEDNQNNHSQSNQFALLLLLFGAMLVIVPEFVYIRDFFGYRINTIFKFYYQAWLLWGLAAAFGTAVLLSELKGGWGFAHYASLVVVLVVGLTYTLFGVWDRANEFDPENGFVLDGAIGVLSQEDAAAAEWLRTAPLGVIAEAVGGSYTGYGRISAHSGQPTVLGWNFHETQWRGGEAEKGTREFDIERLYTSADWIEAQFILQQYDIRYVYVGSLERSSYAVNETKFLRNLTPVFQFGNVIIYEVP